MNLAELKKKRNAVILAHTYQLPEIQDVADFVGDSLELSLKVSETNADVVVFCGVKFMAETAKLISPKKTVLMPEPSAGCPMADMITADELRTVKKKYPDHAVVCYVNSTAEVKAESDICCTSSNAIKVVESIPRDKGVIFVPDINLGTYVKNKLQRDNMVLWPGYCNVHFFVTAEEVIRLKNDHKDAVVFAHPECKTEVLNLADHILSTSGMVKKVAEINKKDFIVITEQGILHPLKKKYPDRNFYALDRMLCPNMKKTTIDMIPESLERMQYKIELSDEIIKKARIAVDKMLKLQ